MTKTLNKKSENGSLSRVCLKLRMGIFKFKLKTSDLSVILPNKRTKFSKNRWRNIK